VVGELKLHAIVLGRNPIERMGVRNKKVTKNNLAPKGVRDKKNLGFWARRRKEKTQKKKIGPRWSKFPRGEAKVRDGKVFSKPRTRCKNLKAEKRQRRSNNYLARPDGDQRKDEKTVWECKRTIDKGDQLNLLC